MPKVHPPSTTSLTPLPAPSKNNLPPDDVEAKAPKDGHVDKPVLSERRVSSEENVMPKCRDERTPFEGRRKKTVQAPTDPSELDIDSRHDMDPLFATVIAKDLYRFLKDLEGRMMDGKGKTLKPKSDVDYVTERVRIHNWLFEKGDKLRIESNTLHLAMFYIDRFYEKYDGPTQPILTVAATGLHLASKYNDIDPIYVSDINRTVSIIRKTKLKEVDVLMLEMTFLKLLKTFAAPTVTAFAHRYLQSVGLELNKAAVWTTRYLCGLAIGYYPFTGEFYSKLAAASVFVAYNKYNISISKGESTIECPVAFIHHSGYTLKDLQPIVKQLVQLATDVERAMTTKEDKQHLPVSVYKHYHSKGVVTVKTFPDFAGYFEQQEIEKDEEENPCIVEDIDPFNRH